MDRLLLLGLNHTTAPLELRERLALDDGRRRAFLLELKSRYPTCEAVLVCTCNRVELYIAREVHGYPRHEEMLQHLAAAGSIDNTALANHVYQKSQRGAVEHLFAVAASLDSMVIGETQILAQVRQAYELSRELELAGPRLHPLFQRAAAVGKE